MQKLLINGGKKLYGKINISPAKNACLPIIASAILLDAKVSLKPCPLIDDVIVMANIIKELGGSYCFKKNELLLDCTNLYKAEGNCDTYRKARASFFTAGAIISRFGGKAIIPLPGGCDLGERPVDIHLEALSALNVKSQVINGCVIFDGQNKRCGKVELRYPSVGATVNLINASVYTPGVTKISNCAQEPEIKDLCDFLNKCGCKILGGGTSEIIIEGVKPISINEIQYSPIYDRIEAGTYMIAVCACGGELEFDCDNFVSISALSKLLLKSGATIECREGKLKLWSNGRIKPLSVKANVYPHFPTDLQPQMCAYLALANGQSEVQDVVFPNRFTYFKELSRFGAIGNLINGKMMINGVKQFNPTKATVTDLRGGAALVIAGLAASGVSLIDNACILDRGYEDLQTKLMTLGASIKRI